MQSRDLTLDHWPRRAALQHFIGMRHPSFSVTVRVEVTGLAARAGRHDATPWLAYHHAALMAANEIGAMRQALTPEGGVREYACVHGSTTVARADGSFGIVTLGHEPLLSRFAATSRPLVERARQASGDLFAADQPLGPAQALVHMTTLPWLAFTSFQHARGADDDRPKLAFGRFTQEGDRNWMPVAVDVHHALVDGVHVGQFIERFQAHLDAT